MSEKKSHLSEAIESAVEKTLNAAADATSPHADEYWYNLATGEVERGQQSAVTSLWGPFKTYEEAAGVVASRSSHPVNPVWQEAYAKYYPLYKGIYQQIKPTIDGIAALGL